MKIEEHKNRVSDMTKKNKSLSSIFGFTIAMWLLIGYMSYLNDSTVGIVVAVVLVLVNIMIALPLSFSVRLQKEYEKLISMYEQGSVSKQEFEAELSYIKKEYDLDQLASEVKEENDNILVEEVKKHNNKKESLEEHKSVLAQLTKSNNSRTRVSVLFGALSIVYIYAYLNIYDQIGLSVSLAVALLAAIEMKKTSKQKKLIDEYEHNVKETELGNMSIEKLDKEFQRIFDNTIKK